MKSFSAFEVQRYTTGTGSNATKTLSIRNGVTETLAKPALRVVFANGAWGGPSSFGPLVKKYLDSATKERIPTEAIMYRDPWFGTGHYEPDHRAERLSAVVRIAAKDKQVQLGSSEAEPFSWRSLMRSVLAEARQNDPVAMLRNPESLAALALASPGRVLLSHGVSEIVQSYAPEVTTTVVSMRTEHTMPIGMVLADKDEFFKPPQDVQKQLAAAGILMRHIDTTHLGAVADARFGASLFDLSSELNCAIS